jgi:hypothetical protein
MLMPYGQNERGNCFSIVINALRAKEKKKFKQFLTYYEGEARKTGAYLRF